MKSLCQIPTLLIEFHGLLQLCGSGQAFSLFDERGGLPTTVPGSCQQRLKPGLGGETVVEPEGEVLGGHGGKAGAQHPSLVLCDGELPHRLVGKVNGVAVAAIGESIVAGLKVADGSGARGRWWSFKKVL